MQDRGRLKVVSGYGSVQEDIHSYIWNGSETWETGNSYVRTSLLTYGTAELVNWVKLSARPGTNQIVLIASLLNNSETTASVRAAVWDGDTGTSNIFTGGTVTGSWSDLSRFANSTSVRYQTEAIDIKHVLGGTYAGDAVAVWGEGQYVYTRIYESDTDSWGSRFTAWDSGSGNTIKWLRLKAKPDSDDLILAIGADMSGVEKLYTIAYDGDTRSWGSISSSHTNIPFGSMDNNRAFDIIWDPGSGSNDLLLVYADATGLRYKTSSNGGSSWNSQQTLSSSHTAYWMQLERDSGDNTIHLAIHDGDDDLNTWTWAGATWTFENEITTDLEQSSSRSAEVIALAAYSQAGGGGGSNSAPTAPTAPYSNNISAQSGQANPTGIIDPTPAFSAIYNDPDAGDIANKYRLEVNTQNDFAGTVMWDSGAGGTSMAGTVAGNRCSDIIYGGTALASDTIYYWRITFWDESDSEGTVSATQNFTTGTISTTTQSWGEDSSRDDFGATTEDTYLDQGQPGYDMGTDTLVRVGDDGGSRINRTLIKYDLSALSGLISNASQIVAATLKMKTYDNPLAGSIDVDVFRVKKDWFEGTQSYAAANEADDAATWQYQVFSETQWTCLLYTSDAADDSKRV